MYRYLRNIGFEPRDRSELADKYLKSDARKNINIKDVIDQYTMGKSSTEIADFYGVSPYIIIDILKNQNIKIRKRSLDAINIRNNIDDIITLYKNGWSTVEIGEKFQCSDSFIGNILKENNIKLRDHRAENNCSWNGGSTSIYKSVRSSLDNKKWVQQCLSRNEFSSSISNHNDKLHCHHIYPFQYIMKSSLIKHSYLPKEIKRRCIVSDQRFYDIANGLIITEKEHISIEKSCQLSHPYWKIWKPFPQFALSNFPLTNDDYNCFNEHGMIIPENIKIVKGIHTNLKNILRYEHYLGTIPPHSIILSAVIGNIIVGIAIFGKGVNKHWPNDTWELSRLCIPYYVVKPFAIDFLSYCIDFIRSNFSNIKYLISFADPNVGHDGAVYRMAGWKKVGLTQSSYCYFDPINNKIRHKANCRRIKGINKTEKELANERKWVRIPLIPKKKYALDLL